MFSCVNCERQTTPLFLVFYGDKNRACFCLITVWGVGVSHATYLVLLVVHWHKVSLFLLCFNLSLTKMSLLLTPKALFLHLESCVIILASLARVSLSHAQGFWDWLQGFPVSCPGLLRLAPVNLFWVSGIENWWMNRQRICDGKY